MMNANGKVEVDSESRAVSVKFLIHHCLDIDINCDEPATSKEICLECVDRLIFIFNFKELCKKNNEFFSYPTTRTILDVDENVIKEEPRFTQPIVSLEEGNELLVEVYKPEDPARQKRRDRREEENRKNAQRQRDKRASETPDESEARRKKTAEQARLRRVKRRLENPEDYAKHLAREAEMTRRRRQNARLGVPSNDQLRYEEQKHQELTMAIKSENQRLEGVRQADSLNVKQERPAHSSFNSATSSWPSGSLYSES